jgi:ribonuclease HII
MKIKTSKLSELKKKKISKTKSIKSELIKFDLSYEEALIGIDEVGRGALAGPVYAAALHFPELKKLKDKWTLDIIDSKLLKEGKRIELSIFIKDNSLWSIRQASCNEINEIGILPATLLAMRRATDDVIKQMSNTNEILLLIDGISRIKDYEYKQTTIKKGDYKSFHIAAASIIAKTARDQHMKEISEQYPHYAWERNVGYGTQAHCDGILKNGASKEHRVKFIRNILEKSTQLSILQK